MNLLHRYLTCCLTVVLLMLATLPAAAQPGKHILKAVTANPRTAAVAAQVERQISKFTYSPALQGQASYLAGTRSLNPYTVPPLYRRR